MTRMQQHDPIWSFNFRTAQFDDSDSSDSEESRCETKARSKNNGSELMSHEKELMKDLDLSTREDNAVYKPNPFTLAKINAAARATAPKPTSCTSGSKGSNTQVKAGSVKRLNRNKPKSNAQGSANGGKSIPAKAAVAPSPEAHQVILSENMKGVPQVKNAHNLPKIGSSETIQIENNSRTGKLAPTSATERNHAHISSKPVPQATFYSSPSIRGAFQFLPTTPEESKINFDPTKPPSRPPNSLNSLSSPFQVWRAPIPHHSATPITNQFQQPSVFSTPMNKSDSQERNEIITPLTTRRSIHLKANHLHPSTPFGAQYHTSGIQHSKGTSSTPRAPVSNKYPRHSQPRRPPSQITPQRQTPIFPKCKPTDAYAFQTEDPDEEWCTLSLASRKKPKLSIFSGKPLAGIKTSGAFRLPGAPGQLLTKKNGMSATSAKRVITFLPPPLVQKPTDSTALSTSPTLLAFKPTDSFTYPSPANSGLSTRQKRPPSSHNMLQSSLQANYPHHDSYRPPSPPSSDLPVELDEDVTESLNDVKLGTASSADVYFKKRGICFLFQVAATFFKTIITSRTMSEWSCRLFLGLLWFEIQTFEYTFITLFSGLPASYYLLDLSLFDVLNCARREMDWMEVTDATSLYLIHYTIVNSALWYELLSIKIHGNLPMTSEYSYDTSYSPSNVPATIVSVEDLGAQEVTFVRVQWAYLINNIRYRVLSLD
ncbi:hypothetical protein BDQ12DRAFT_764600 [Crucibulum laeve]|uniref:Uncharacterized protein n=1 Tax=Crucibulum laeve TaxID=68775 RepID=A0A5C3LN25_9AGAR|nr:hypothetical protein BDQ12DRAFT_764600 [Crucibulum laeve]